MKNNTFYLFFDNVNDSDKYLLFDYFFKILIDFYKFDEILNEKYILKFYFYFSSQDLTIALGVNNILPYYVNKQKSFKNKLIQRRSIYGTLKFIFVFNGYKISIIVILRDLFGSSSRGLNSLIESAGLKQSLEDKTLMDRYKTNISFGLKNHPIDFLLYALNDALVLFDIVDSKVESTNSTLIDIFSIDDKSVLFTKYTIPYSLGRLVSTIWIIYIKHCVFRNDSVLILASKKIAWLFPTHKSYSKAKEYQEKLYEFNSLKELYDFKESNRKQFLDMFNLLSKGEIYQYDIFSYCSIRYLIDISIGSRIELLAMTTGGRTVNERPQECSINYGADIDILSAYGGELERLYFAMGKPHIYSTPSNSEKILTLGQFLHQYQKKLEFYKQYKILVSGQLSFEQDLIHSKIPTESSILNKKKNFYELEQDKQQIDSSFVLLRREIINGSITASTLDILKKVCSNIEMKEFLNLEVIGALFYLDSDVSPSLELFLESILKDKKRVEIDYRTSMIADNRTYNSYLIPLNPFIQPLLTKRKELKKMKDSKSQALSSSLKDLINTLWGIFTSVHFQCNNVLNSELVTNSIRNSVWLMSKAFNTHMSITDGGGYSLMNVTFIKKSNLNFKLPGLEKLSSFYFYSKHRNIHIAPLNNINWRLYFENNKSPFEGDFLKLDVFAQEHLAKFWGNYGISINFKVEHKIDRCFIRCAYINKSHYAMIIYDSNLKKYFKKIWVIRGFKLERKIKYKNTIFHFFFNSVGLCMIIIVIEKFMCAFIWSKTIAYLLYFEPRLVYWI